MNNAENRNETVPRKTRNWPLAAGILLVAIIAILAVIGPTIAPKDPAEEINITMINGTWYIPPFDIGTPGYPLGSDSFGRDLYSRLLWGIRPTMVMVFVVAIVRLILGVAIGLSAGWFTGKTNRLLNGLIQIALALPVLLVALGAIAIVGVELGIWAFIIGLSLTGWVDTALQVREQTRIVKGQIYVEAASAIGASNKQILSNHILKQIGPMLLMLFAFEISSTLMLTAGLGFLGYYIGGDVWVETSDFVARRISGAPELGQMLATSWVTLTKPWAMVAVGTTIFITVLGFNLIGEGLRQNMGLSKVSRKSLFTESRIKFGMWIDNYIWHPAVQFFRIKPLQIGLTMIGVFFILSMGALILLDYADQSNLSNILVNSDQESQSGVSRTIIESEVPPTDNSLIEETSISISYDPSVVWEFDDESGFAGGPVHASDSENLFIASQGGTVYSIGLNGDLIWQSELASGAVGSPAVDPNNNIYVADSAGGLNKLSPEGELIWHFQTEAGDRAHSGPSIGPNGNIFYTVGIVSKGFVQAVNPDGEGIWATEANTRIFFENPVPSLDGNYVYLKDDVFSSTTGELLELDYDLDVNRFFSGDNGNNYLVSGHKIIQWTQVENSIETIDIYDWDSSGFSEFVSPAEVGVDQNGNSWLMFTTPGGNTRVIWVSNQDQFLGTSSIKSSNSTLVDYQDDLSSLVCGGGSFNSTITDCAEINPSEEEPLWDFHIGNYGPVLGGFNLNDRHFIATEEGYLFEITDNKQEVSTSISPETQSPGSSMPSGYGLQWIYNTNVSEGGILNLHKDVQGQLYVATGDDRFHILNPDGELQNIIKLPAPPFHEISPTGRSASLDIYPEVLSDGTIVYVSEDLILYVFNSSGDILTEQTLQAAPGQPPLVDDNSMLFLLDTDGGLNAINRNGVAWRFQSDAATIPANGFVLGPEGNIYYVVTNYSQAYIQAVSSEGENLWISMVETRDFYDDLRLSHDGKFISLAGDLFQTSNGEIIDFNSSNKIDEYFFSDNGQNFFRSLHSVSEWEMGQSGIQILSEGTVSEENTTLRPPLGADVDSSGIIWLYYPSSYSGRGVNLVWMDASGNLLGTHLLDWDPQSIISTDLEKSSLTDCTGFQDTRTVDCKLYFSNSSEPVSEVLLTDIPEYHSGIILEDFLYLFSNDYSIYSFYIGEPAAQ